MIISSITPYREGIKNCNICDGVGFYLNEIVQGSREGVLSLCSCVINSCNTCDSKGQAPFYSYDSNMNKMMPCLCHGARIRLNWIEQKLAEAQIPPKYKFKFLNYIDPNTCHIDFWVACDWADELITNWHKPEFWVKNKKQKRGMYLYGGTGTGKTLLACIILNELIFRYGIECKYAKINKDFLSAIKDTYQKDSEFHGQERSIEMDFADVEVLVIDDFGVQKESEWVNTKLYDLIDARYEKQKITLLTSNIKIEDVKTSGGGRIHSRLIEMAHYISLERCPDFRMNFIR